MPAKHVQRHLHVHRVAEAFDLWILYDLQLLFLLHFHPSWFVIYVTRNTGQNGALNIYVASVMR